MTTDTSGPITFRLPMRLLTDLDGIVSRLEMTRSAAIVEAVRLWVASVCGADGVSRL